MDEHFEIPQTEHELILRKQAAFTALKKAEKNFHITEQMRTDYLNDAIEDHIIHGRKREAAELRRLQRAEASGARVFRKCAYARNKIQQGSLASIKIPVHPTDDYQTCVTWKTITDPQEIETQLTTLVSPILLFLRENTTQLLYLTSTL